MTNSAEIAVIRAVVGGIPETLAVAVPVSVKVPAYGPVATPDAVNEKFPTLEHATIAGPPVDVNTSVDIVVGGAAPATPANATAPNATHIRISNLLICFSSPA